MTRIKFLPLQYRNELHELYERYSQESQQQHDGWKDDDCWLQVSGLPRHCEAHFRWPHQEGFDEDQEGTHRLQEEARCWKEGYQEVVRQRLQA